MRALRANESSYPETDKRVLKGTMSATIVRDRYALHSAVHEIWGRLNANAQEGLNEACVQKRRLRENEDPQRYTESWGVEGTVSATSPRSLKGIRLADGEQWACLYAECR